MTDTTQPQRSPHACEGRVIAVLGPTASGKTAVAEELAVRLGSRVISADSMQVYRGMDVGTAKPAPSQRRVAYECIDLADPGEPFSAALYQREARDAIARAHVAGEIPILAGGTGLYVRAALDDWTFPAGRLASPVREQLEKLATGLTPVELHERLRAVDPGSAELIHPNNVRRVLRALEMLSEGVSYADQHAGFGRRRSVFDARMFALTMDRDALYARIDERVRRMIHDGLLSEVAGLLDAGYGDALTAAQAIGYKELVPVVEAMRSGTSSEKAGLPEAQAAIAQATRHYAKRQMTWLRADERIEWIDVTSRTPAETVAGILSLLESW
jgi:tRNA dimethylallyltransferase